jgi:diguanylate cyclase (GGDEF)-like protein
MIDIDHFKMLNDTHGHQAGDEVLRAVARAIKDQSRAFDTPARYGGEEFAVIMPSCDVDDAERSAERFRHAVAKLGGAAPVTVSAGVATFPVHATDADSLVQKADGALYESKGAGRNRTTVAHPTLAEGADQLLSELEPGHDLGRTESAETRSEDVGRPPPGETAGNEGGPSGTDEPPAGGRGPGSAPGSWH